MNTIFASEKLENSDNLVDAFANTIINNVEYELNAATASDAQVKILINSEKFITIRIRHKEVSFLPPPMNLTIGIILLPPQMLKLPAVQDIVTYAASNNMGKNRTMRQKIRAGVDRTTPVHSVVSENTTPDPSDNSKTRINKIQRIN